MKRLANSVPVQLGVLAAGLLVAPATKLNATINTEIWGTSAPNATLGGYAVLPFSADSRNLGDQVASFTPPPGSTVSGDMLSDIPLEHSSVGNGWGTWGNSYNGDVYWLDEETYGSIDPVTGLYASSLTLTLPADTKAFYFYLEPNFFGTFDFVVSSDSVSKTLQVDGNGGAQGIGFYTDDPSLSLASIQIEREGGFSDGYAIGEFGINGVAPQGLPEGGASAGLLAALVFGLFKMQERLERRSVEATVRQQP